MKKVSIIVRTKNEEKWIGLCLGAIRKQSYRNYEIILVDNKSSDKTIEKASGFGVNLVKVDKFIPGMAINEGIRASTGEYIVCISGHCIPTNEHWLENLVAALQDKEIGGVYGRQEPMSFTNPLDKRDLLTVFGLDKKIQVKDYFFHNANSAFRRDVWEKVPFCEEATNIEDRIWGKEIISLGYKIAYEPDASVFHWHGINHALDEVRAKKIVKILEHMNEPNADVRTVNKESICIVPVRVKDHVDIPLQLKKVSEQASSVIDLKNIYISIDAREYDDCIESLSMSVVHRQEDLSNEYIDITDVLAFTLNEIELQGIFPDLIVVLELGYDRDRNDISAMCRKINEEGFDTLIAVVKEKNTIWIEKNGDIQLITGIPRPSILREINSFISKSGYCLVTHPVNIRNKNIYDSNTGLYCLEGK
jgi:rhamnosyltransferase